MLLAIAGASTAQHAPAFATQQHVSKALLTKLMMKWLLISIGTMSLTGTWHCSLRSCGCKYTCYLPIRSVCLQPHFIDCKDTD